MKNLIKFSVIFLGFFIIFSSNSIAADRILPLPKPAVDQDTKNITTKKKEIYPQKKPIKKTEEIETATKILDESKESIIIYPQKKPVVFKKKIDKAVAKSTILSSSDFKIAKAVFGAIKKKKMENSHKNFKKG